MYSDEKQTVKIEKTKMTELLARIKASKILNNNKQHTNKQRRNEDRKNIANV